MTLRLAMALIGFATLLAWGAWCFVIWTTNPADAGIPGFSMFYLTLLMGLIGTLTLLGVAYRVILLKRRDVIIREVKVSFRHGVFLGVIGVAALALSAKDLLRWWGILGLMIVVCLLEYLFLMKDSARRY